MIILKIYQDKFTNVDALKIIFLMVITISQMFINVPVFTLTKGTEEIFIQNLENNLGDPALFPGTQNIESLTIKILGELFDLPPSGTGRILTGGSEANITALWAIRNKVRKELQGSPHNQLEIIAPSSAHISIDKAADLLGIKLRKAKLQDNFELDLEHFSSLINNNTCGVVGIAGTTSLGLIDPIEEIGRIIEDKDIFFHIDAAFGGFILPFLTELNYSVPAWDFSVNSVDSITADPHKMGLGIIPSGGFFIRDSSILQKTGFEIPYLAGGNFKHFHIVGTRSGGTVIAFWVIMKTLGINGFKDVVKKCMKNTQYLTNRINEIKGVKLATNPVINVVGITTESNESICKIDEELRKKNWMVGKFEDFNLIRVVIMPHVQNEHLQDFTDDLEKIIKKLNIS